MQKACRRVGITRWPNNRTDKKREEQEEQTEEEQREEQKEQEAKGRKAEEKREKEDEAAPNAKPNAKAATGKRASYEIGANVTHQQLEVSDRPTPSLPPQVEFRRDRTPATPPPPQSLPTCASFCAGTVPLDHRAGRCAHRRGQNLFAEGLPAGGNYPLAE